MLTNDSSFRVDLGAWFRANGVRQKDLADALGVDASTITRLKHRPLTAAQRAIVRVLVRLGPHDGLILLSAGEDTDRVWDRGLAAQLGARYHDGDGDPVAGDAANEVVATAK